MKKIGCLSRFWIFIWKERCLTRSWIDERICVRVEAGCIHERTLGPTQIEAGLWWKKYSLTRSWVDKTIIILQSNWCNRPDYTPADYLGILWPRPIHAPQAKLYPMILITISIALSDILRPYPLRPEFASHQGRIYPCGGLCAMVLVDQWRRWRNRQNLA